MVFDRAGVIVEVEKQMGRGAGVEDNFSKVDFAVVNQQEKPFFEIEENRH